MAKKQIDIEEEAFEIDDESIEDEDNDFAVELIPEIGTFQSTSEKLNAGGVVIQDTYDAVIWDNKNLPLEIAASRAFTALKTGGVFIVDIFPELDNMVPLLLTMFDSVYKVKQQAYFVKEA